MPHGHTDGQMDRRTDKNKLRQYHYRIFFIIYVRGNCTNPTKFLPLHFVENNSSIIIANVYAQTGLNRDKVEFFSNFKREIEKLRNPIDNVYLMGDFNTDFGSL